MNIPKGERAEEFKKEDHQLFPIHLHITSNGSFIFINFDKSPNPTPFDDFYQGLQVDLGGLTAPQGFTFYNSISVEGNFNWKIAIDNYQGNRQLSSSKGSNAKGSIIHFFFIFLNSNSSRHLGL